MVKRKYYIIVHYRYYKEWKLYSNCLTFCPQNMKPGTHWVDLTLSPCVCVHIYSIWFNCMHTWATFCLRRQILIFLPLPKHVFLLYICQITYFPSINTLGFTHRWPHKTILYIHRPNPTYTHTHVCTQTTAPSLPSVNPGLLWQATLIRRACSAWTHHKSGQAISVFTK